MSEKLDEVAADGLRRAEDRAYRIGVRVGLVWGLVVGALLVALAGLVV